ncbi:hypothetical protein LVJ83_04635 [Uruburuella testudinis]|uniref:Enoyl-CoA hydratase n=1 Tax=Uruburuella testudinis TaxID=1282863 RepID=A0ABY4DVR8_9NEIS|nr:hypothetical protein [Uruburuella testudinis]UOO82755.1 hypothetical protein LVJ83_04635 [Uruburuella testudinis]
MTRPTIYLALYKGRKSIKRPYDLIARFSDWLTRLLTAGPYSHCEISIQRSDGLLDCYSSSIRDGGVRCKTMPLPSEKWDLIPLPSDIAAHTRLQFVFSCTRGRGYDWLGAVGVIVGTRHRRNKWFCSEWCAYALGHTAPHHYSPNSLAKLQSALAPITHGQ